MYDYLVVGSGLYGAIFAHEAKAHEPYYPVNDAKNGALYEEYSKLADTESKVIFGGRLGEYKYYDMDQVIAAALDCVATHLNE